MFAICHVSFGNFSYTICETEATIPTDEYIVVSHTKPFRPNNAVVKN